ncbi:hypothetical protein OKW43_007390 [Paraburkholderia sp. WC7.3g]
MPSRQGLYSNFAFRLIARYGRRRIIPSTTCVRTDPRVCVMRCPIRAWLVRRATQVTAVSRFRRCCRVQGGSRSGVTERCMSPMVSGSARSPDSQVVTAGIAGTNGATALTATMVTKIEVRVAEQNNGHRLARRNRSFQEPVRLQTSVVPAQIHLRIPHDRVSGRYDRAELRAREPDPIWRRSCV